MANLTSLKEAAAKAAAVRKEMEARIAALNAQIAEEQEKAQSQVNEGMEEFQDEFLLIAGLAPEGMILALAPRPADGKVVPMFVPVKTIVTRKSSTKTTEGSGYANKKKEYLVKVDGTLIPDVTSAGAIRRYAMGQEDWSEEDYCNAYNAHGGKCDATKGIGNFPGWALNGAEVPMLKELGIDVAIKEITNIVPATKPEDKPTEETKSELPETVLVKGTEPTDEELKAIEDGKTEETPKPGSVMELALALTGNTKERKVKKS